MYCFSFEGSKNKWAKSRQMNQTRSKNAEMSITGNKQAEKTRKLEHKCYQEYKDYWTIQEQSSKRGAGVYVLSMIAGDE